MRILLAEDNMAQAESLELVLEKEGHVVYRAANGLAAQAFADLHAVDAAVIDMVMPGVDGLTLLAWLRGRPATETIPVVLCTGLSKADVPEVVKTAANVTLLQKPYSVYDLLVALGAKV